MASYLDRKTLMNCPVCLEHFRQLRKLPTCKHVFCESCITDTIGKLKTRGDEGVNENTENESGFPCPLCRVVNNFPRNTEDLSTWVSTLEMAEEEQKEVEMKVENMEDCMPCKKQNKSTQAVKYCIDCRESLCAQCFEETQKFTIFEGHTALEIKDTGGKNNVWNLKQTLARCLACKNHPDKNVTLVCQIHDELCCQTCLVSNHRECDKVTELQQHIVEADVQTDSNRFKEPIKESVNQFITRCQNVMKNIKENTAKNKLAVDGIDQNLRDMRTKANQLFDMLEEKLSQDSKAHFKEQTLSNDAVFHEMEEMIGKLKLSCSLLDSVTVKEDQTLEYVVHRRILDLLSQSETQLFETLYNTKIYGFELELNNSLSDFLDVDLNESSKLATLKHTEIKIDLAKHISRYRKITKTGTYNIQAKGFPGIYPTYSGVAYTDSDKVLLADSNYGMICLLSDTYTHLASCNGTAYTFQKAEKDSAKKAFSVSLLDNDIVVTSVPEKKTMFVIEANQNLKIQTEIDLPHSAKALVGLSNGDIAVSWTDPVAFGVLSLRLFHAEEKSYFNHDKSGRVLKSFDYMAVDRKSLHVIQPCSVDKAVFCFDLQMNPIFEYRHNELEHPAGVGIDADGLIYVCDTANGCIHIISPNGYPVSIYKEDCPERPLAVAFDKAGTTFAITRGHKDFSEYYDKKRSEVCVYRLSDRDWRQCE